MRFLFYKRNKQRKSLFLILETDFEIRTAGQVYTMMFSLASATTMNHGYPRCPVPVYSVPYEIKNKSQIKFTMYFVAIK